MTELSDFNQLSDYLWEIPKTYRSDMLVPARIYATKEMLLHIFDEKAILQLVNMATLPGIHQYALAMPDIHQGYGFPIGGIAAMRVEDGVISPGGVGYDINCGVRLLTTPYAFPEIKDKLVDLANQMQRDIPSGVGRGGPLRLSGEAFDRVLNHGAKWAVKQGYGFPEDIDMTEEEGCFRAADASLVSQKAKERGADQLGTLGAGNHFVEIQKVVEVYDKKTATVFGLFKDQIAVMIHTGSRGFGHQVCTDYVGLMNKNLQKFHFILPDRELSCAPFKSQFGQDYYVAMAAAANFAWANRQLIMDHVRESWQRVMGCRKDELSLLYDVAHNIAKIEYYFGKEVIVHRKGATRAFGPQHSDLPQCYKKTGQPVLIPGSMGTSSYVLAGTNDAMQHTFGSCCHGAGRQMSRSKAKKSFNYNELQRSLKDYGVIVRSGSAKGLLEEAPKAYKDIEQVIDVVANANIARKVAKLKPIAVIKG